MRCVSSIALVLVLFVVAAVSSIGLAADPDEDDVTVVGFQNAPHCPGPVYDGAIKVSNSSDEYWYKVVVVARVENDSNGNSRCDNNQPCSGESCECDLSNNAIVSKIGETSIVKESCGFPSCGGCPTSNCDTGNSGDCEDPPADHCTCVIGNYRVTEYSDDFGETWNDLFTLGPIAITQKENNPLCPNPGPSCD